jgi:hypothetical protein
MKIGILVAGLAVLAGTYFLLPSLAITIYATYAGYGLGAILVLAGLLGKKRLY